MPSPVRRLTVAAGLATVVVGAALATAGDWSGAGDAEPTATAALAAVAESPAVADQDGEAVAHATTGPGAQ